VVSSNAHTSLPTLQPPEKQQLLKDDVVLEDAKKLSDLKVENEDTLALTFQQEGGCTNP
jgi:transcription elongation factor B subunit 2